jgi:hypothetical protein
MQGLTTDLVGSACRIFLALAYPDGEDTIPQPRRVYLTLPPGQGLADFLAATPAARALCQAVRDDRGHVQGQAIRLGSAAFPHLKLRVQQVCQVEPPVWVFSVDTHDAFSRDCLRPPREHPEAAEWMRLQGVNQQLKERVERAWEEVGLYTFNRLLRSDLEQSGPAGGAG